MLDFLSLSRLHAPPLCHTSSHGIWIRQSKSDDEHRRLLLCKSKISGHTWQETILPGYASFRSSSAPLSRLSRRGPTPMPKWMQMTIASDAIGDHDVLWTLPHQSGEIVCSVTDETFFNDLHDSDSTSRGTSPPSPPWLVKINDGKSSCQCVSASKHALWVLTCRGDVLVRAGISRKQPLGTSWKQLDMVQLRDTVSFLDVGKTRYFIIL